MEFTLVYQGPLKSNGTIKDKQLIRRRFHSQLQILWKQKPLVSHRGWLQENSPKGDFSLIRRVGVFSFAPLIVWDLSLLAELEMIFLRPENPGSLITQGGDIDNRLKTLFDALRIPTGELELPRGDKPLADEEPFFCLLEDDILISKISVETDRLLEITPDKNHVHLIIKVRTRKISSTWGNMALG